MYVAIQCTSIIKIMHLFVGKIWSGKKLVNRKSFANFPAKYLPLETAIANILSWNWFRLAQWQCFTHPKSSMHSNVISRYRPCNSEPL